MRIMNTAELVVVAVALAGAATAKAMEMIDTSTTLGVAASMGCGLFSAGALGAVGLATTAYYRRATRL